MTDPDPTGMRMTKDDGSPGVAAVGDSECLEESKVLRTFTQNDSAISELTLLTHYIAFF